MYITRRDVGNCKVLQFRWISTAKHTIAHREFAGIKEIRSSRYNSLVGRHARFYLARVGSLARKSSNRDESGSLPLLLTGPLSRCSRGRKKKFCTKTAYRFDHHRIIRKHFTLFFSFFMNLTEFKRIIENTVLFD